MGSMAMARGVAADAVQAVGDRLGAAAGNAAATATVAAIGAKTGGLGAIAAAGIAPSVASGVQNVAGAITDRAANAVRGPQAENPLDTSFTPGK